MRTIFVMKDSARISRKKALKLFGQDPQASAFADWSQGRALTKAELCELGRQHGFLKAAHRPQTICFFVTKGGVLKTSLAFNTARLAALHGVSTCVIGLDLQADITRLLLPETSWPTEASLDEALSQMNSIEGLADFYFRKSELKTLVRPTDLPNLWCLPETAELVQLEQALQTRNRREYWLADQVIKPLQSVFDLIILDASPNWTQLTTNALIAADMLVSPFECRINNYKNAQMFVHFIDSFKNDMATELEWRIVPTKWSPGRRLSAEILADYQLRYQSRVTRPIREHLFGEEATALGYSVPEYRPDSEPAQEMRAVVTEIWESLYPGTQRVKSNPSATMSLPGASAEAPIIRQELDL